MSGRRLAHASVWLGLGLLVSPYAMLQTQGFQQAVGDLSQPEVRARGDHHRRSLPGPLGRRCGSIRCVPTSGDNRRAF
jgi:hypothetical protein